MSNVLASPSSSMPLNIRNLKVSLSPVKKHHVLFLSPVLNRLIVPFFVQTDFFDSNGFSSNSAEKESPLPITSGLLSNGCLNHD